MKTDSCVVLLARTNVGALAWIELAGAPQTFAASSSSSSSTGGSTGDLTSNNSSSSTAITTSLGGRDVLHTPAPVQHLHASTGIKAATGGDSSSSSSRAHNRPPYTMPLQKSELLLEEVTYKRYLTVYNRRVRFSAAGHEASQASDTLYCSLGVGNVE